MDSEDFGSNFHPDSREVMGNSKDGGFVAISKNNGFFAVQSVVGLILFLFDGLNFAGLLLGVVLVEEVSNFDGGGLDKAVLGVDQVFTSNTELTFAGGGEFKSFSVVDVGNSARWVRFGNLGQGQDFTLVVNFAVLVEAFWAGNVSSAEAARKPRTSRDVLGGAVSSAVDSITSEGEGAGDRPTVGGRIGNTSARFLNNNFAWGSRAVLGIIGGSYDWAGWVGWQLNGASFMA